MDVFRAILIRFIEIIFVTKSINIAVFSQYHSVSMITYGTQVNILFIYPTHHVEYILIKSKPQRISLINLFHHHWIDPGAEFGRTSPSTSVPKKNKEEGISVITILSQVITVSIISQIVLNTWNYHSFFIHPITMIKEDHPYPSRFKPLSYYLQLSLYKRLKEVFTVPEYIVHLGTNIDHYLLEISFYVSHIIKMI